VNLNLNVAIVTTLFCRVCGDPLPITALPDAVQPSRCARCESLASRRAARWRIDMAKGGA
jgi:hypothetical protein